MSQDLSRILDDWPYEPGQLSVRMIEGDDGKPKIQMRVDLGVLQMEVEGRPDGMRPDDAESVLEAIEAELDAHIAEGGEAEAFKIDGDTCRILREEAAQYYHRYVALFILEEYEGVVRDTSRNLRVLDLCRNHADDEEDALLLEQYRPYLEMMRARALASEAIRDQEPKAALLAIDEALARIKEMFEEAEQGELYDQAPEVQLLKGMRDQLVPKLPVSPQSELKDRLKRAIEAENYELAAILRDELRMMKD